MVLDIKSSAYTLGIVVGIWYIICVLTFWISPEFATSIGSYIFHGVETTSTVDISVKSAVIGFFISAVFASITGAVFALIYNKLEK